jgi:hypothetical protein
MFGAKDSANFARCADEASKAVSAPAQQESLASQVAASSSPYIARERDSLSSKSPVASNSPIFRAVRTLSHALRQEQKTQTLHFQHIMHFGAALFRAPCQQSERQLPHFQSSAHSFVKTPGVGGTARKSSSCLRRQQKRTESQDSGTSGRIWRQELRCRFDTHPEAHKEPINRIRFAVQKEKLQMHLTSDRVIPVPLAV